MTEVKQNFWAMPIDTIIQQLGTNEDGLSGSDAKKRLASFGLNSIKPKKQTSALGLLISQFKSPIILILLFAIGLSFFLKDTVDALIILLIVMVSGFLGFWQEYAASNAVAELLAMVQIKSAVIRDGSTINIAIEEIVPGDVVIIQAGDIVPSDCILIESNSLFVDESTLTGETFPAEKEAGVLPEETSLAQRKNSLWMGTHVISGTWKAIVLKTGKDTEFGKISERLRIKP